MQFSSLRQSLILLDSRWGTNTVDKIFFDVLLIWKDDSLGISSNWDKNLIVISNCTI